MNKSVFIVTINYVKPLSEIEEYLEDHRRFLDRHYQTGQFICSGPQNPRKGGVIICCGDTKGEIERLIEEDPFHRYELATYDIIQFTPNRYSTQFEHLLQHLE